jgi:hypothetical protein
MRLSALRPSRGSLAWCIANLAVLLAAGAATAGQAGTVPVYHVFRSRPFFGGRLTAPPLVSADGATVFLGASASLLAVGRATGELRWVHETGPSGRDLAPLAQSPGGAVIVRAMWVSPAQHWVALDAASGTALWERTVDESGAALAMDPDGRTVYVGTLAFLRALDLATGEERWNVAVDADSLGTLGAREAIPAGVARRQDRRCEAAYLRLGVPRPAASNEPTPGAPIPPERFATGRFPLLDVSFRAFHIGTSRARGPASARMTANP